MYRVTVREITPATEEERKLRISHHASIVLEQLPESEIRVILRQMIDDAMTNLILYGALPP
jgi:hypothetical protein